MPPSFGEATSSRYSCTKNSCDREEARLCLYGELPDMYHSMHVARQGSAASSIRCSVAPKSTNRSFGNHGGWMERMTEERFEHTVLPLSFIWWTNEQLRSSLLRREQTE